MRATPLGLLVCVAGGAVVGATYDRIPGTALNDERVARDLVLKHLPNEADTQFRNVRIRTEARPGPPIEWVCGEVDRRRGGDSRAAFRRFVVARTGDNLQIEPDVRATRADVAAKLAECQAFQASGWIQIARECDHDAKSLGDDADREAHFAAVWSSTCLSPSPTTIVAGDKSDRQSRSADQPHPALGLKIAIARVRYGLPWRTP
jgi:hypothetical protein